MAHTSQERYGQLVDAKLRATLVTKDTGGYGGFRAKADAAREAGCDLVVVERPQTEEGLTLEEVQRRLLGEERI